MLIALAPGAVAAPPANAADLYRQAFRWLDDERGRGESVAQELATFGNGMQGGSADLSATGARVRPYVELLRSAAAAPRCDWALDRRRGYLMDFSHLARLREATRFLQTDAQLRMQAGDVDGVVENLVAMARFAEHLRGETAVASSVVSANILSLQDRVLEEALGLDGMDAERADRLLRAFEPFAGSDPLRLGAALEGEAELLRATFTLEGDDLAKAYDLLTTWTEEKPDLATLTAQVPDAERALGDLRDALEGEDREAISARVAEVTAKIQAGDYGDLAKLGTPLALQHVLASGWRMQDAMEARQATLRGLRDGTISPASLANAAHAYLALATLGVGMPVDAQAEIEAARVLHGQVDDAARARIRAIIGHRRPAIVAGFLRAARCGRCDFSVAGGVATAYLPHYLGGLRAAFRIHLADALLGPDPDAAEPPPTIEQALAAGLRLAGHLALDPRLGHSLVATTVLVETADALDAALERGLLDREAIERLSLLLASVSRTDPLGFGAALKRDIERMRERGWSDDRLASDPTTLTMQLLVQQIADDVYEDGLGPIESRTPDTPLPPPWRDEILTQPLSGLADLASPASLSAARAAIVEAHAETVRQSERAQRTGDWSRFKAPAIRLDPPPCDPTALALRAAETLSRIDDALKN